VCLYTASPPLRCSSKGTTSNKRIQFVPSYLVKPFCLIWPLIRQSVRISYSKQVPTRCILSVFSLRLWLRASISDGLAFLLEKSNVVCANDRITRPIRSLLNGPVRSSVAAEMNPILSGRSRELYLKSVQELLFNVSTLVFTPVILISLKWVCSAYQITTL